MKSWQNITNYIRWWDTLFYLIAHNVDFRWMKLSSLWNWVGNSCIIEWSSDLLLFFVKWWASNVLQSAVWSEVKELVYVNHFVLQTGFVRQCKNLLTWLLQAALDAVTTGVLDNLENNIKSIQMLGKAPGSFTRPFLQSVGQMPLLEQV